MLKKKKNAVFSIKLLNGLAQDVLKCLSNLENSALVKYENMKSCEFSLVERKIQFKTKILLFFYVARIYFTPTYGN